MACVVSPITSSAAPATSSIIGAIRWPKRRSNAETPSPVPNVALADRRADLLPAARGTSGRGGLHAAASDQPKRQAHAAPAASRRVEVPTAHRGWRRRRRGWCSRGYGPPTAAHVIDVHRTRRCLRCGAQHGRSTHARWTPTTKRRNCPRRRQMATLGLCSTAVNVAIRLTDYSRSGRRLLPARVRGRCWRSRRSPSSCNALEQCPRDRWMDIG